MPTYYHASLKVLSPGTPVELGHPSNFSPVPLAWVFFSDNLAANDFWADFLGGESMAEKLGFFPDVYTYVIEPPEYYEPDPWSEAHKVKGCWQTKSPLIVKSLLRVDKGE